MFGWGKRESKNKYKTLAGEYLTLKIMNDQAVEIRKSLLTIQQWVASPTEKPGDRLRIFVLLENNTRRVKDISMFLKIMNHRNRRKTKIMQLRNENRTIEQRVKTQETCKRKEESLDNIIKKLLNQNKKIILKFSCLI